MNDRDTVIGFGSKSADGARRRPVQSRAIQTREHIIEATAQVLARAGYVDLTTNAVAERAGIGVGTLYRYFADKDDLVRALQARTAARIQAELDAVFLKLAVHGHAQPRDAVVAMTRAVFSVLSQHRGLVRILTQELPAETGDGLQVVITRSVARVAVGIYCVSGSYLAAEDADEASLVIEVGSTVLTTACVRLVLEDRAPEACAEALELIGDMVAGAFAATSSGMSAPKRGA
ncbi:TetR/AcrR family transcriptional regulator [Nocardia sp. IFM 10818]